ncbi:putative membrane protein [Streptococcus pneumoniae GA13723]|nr:putative membrane protein [Streptococcus pneumoniae GA13723]EJG49665.1 putative membrane protein [Streptococcus pneumoniae 2070768]
MRFFTVFSNKKDKVLSLSFSFSIALVSMSISVFFLVQ